MQSLTIQRACTDPLTFMLSYRDPAKAERKGYLGHSDFVSAVKLRTLLETGAGFTPEQANGVLTKVDWTEPLIVNFING